MREPIPVPIGVLLCDYKLGFGLVKSSDRKFENFQKPLCLGSPDSPVHRRAGADPISDVHCPVCTEQAL
jgi:hypothetical protein